MHQGTGRGGWAHWDGREHGREDLWSWLLQVRRITIVGRQSRRSGGGHADGWRKAGAYGGPRRSLVRELRRGVRSGVRCADACALAQHCGRRLQQRQGRGTGGTGERSWGRRRVRVPETTLSPRLRASARLLFPGRRPIATRASGPLAARAVGSLSKYGGRRRVRGGGVTRTSE